MRVKALIQAKQEFPEPPLRPSLFEDRVRMDAFLERTLAIPTFGSPCPVPAAMHYAVMGDAQRYRPILALRVARMLNAESEHVLRAAAAVEILHSASLVVDDLPCMDNELMRRGRPAVHIQFGEPTAVLAAHSMVALAARIVMEAPATDREFLRIRRFQLALLKTLDCAALVGGQSLDLALEGDRRDEMREVMNDLKTTPLFQLAVEAGCVSHTFGPPSELEEFGRHFGLAFQLTDDLLDGELQNLETLHQQYDRCRASLASFGENAQPLHDLIQHLAERAEAQSHSHR
jgi:geranylgeranyl pyrophosphate synthase